MTRSFCSIFCIALITLMMADAARAQTPSTQPTAKQSSDIQKEIQSIKAALKADQEIVKKAREELKVIKERIKPNVARLRANREKLEALYIKAKEQRATKQEKTKNKIDQKMDVKETLTAVTATPAATRP